MYILRHKTNLNKFKRIKIMQSISSNHKEIKLEVSNRKIKHLETKNRFLNNPWAKAEAQEKF